MGHEDQFPPLGPSDRWGVREGTFAGTCGNDKDAPIAAIPRVGVNNDRALAEQRSGWPLGQEGLPSGSPYNGEVRWREKR
jgi:hypothetical protein